MKQVGGNAEIYRSPRARLLPDTASRFAGFYATRQTHDVTRLLYTTPFPRFKSFSYADENEKNKRMKFMKCFEISFKNLLSIKKNLLCILGPKDPIKV